MVLSSAISRSPAVGGLRIPKALPSLRSLRARPSVRAMAVSPDKIADLIPSDMADLHTHLAASLLILADTATMAAEGAAEAAPVDNGWLQPLVTALETSLKFLQSGLTKVGAPYSYGWSIVLLTLCVKVLTFPLTKKQIESSMAVQKLKPQLDALKARYGDNKDQIQKETAILYEEAGVDPLAGCLPSLATMPIFIGLYRSLTSVAETGVLDKEGFYWIPSLAGPTTLDMQKAGLGTAWLFPFVDGQPPIGWENASLYLVLPVALLAAQYVSIAVTTPPINDNDENASTQKAIIYGLPLMIGWFSLNVPAGLSLYYFANTVFTTLVQVYLKKLGGADVKINLPLWTAGTARRSGQAAEEDVEAQLRTEMEATASSPAAALANPLPALSGATAEAMGFSDMAGLGIAEPAAAAMVEAEARLNMRCKRKRTALTLNAAKAALEAQTASSTGANGAGTGEQAAAA